MASGSYLDIDVDMDFDELFAKYSPDAAPASLETPPAESPQSLQEPSTSRPSKKPLQSQSSQVTAPIITPKIKSVVVIPPGSPLARQLSASTKNTPTLASVLAAKPRSKETPSPSMPTLPPTHKQVCAYGQTFSIPLVSITKCRRWKAWHPAGKVVFLFDKAGNVRRCSLLKDKTPPTHIY